MIEKIKTSSVVATVTQNLILICHILYNRTCIQNRVFSRRKVSKQSLFIFQISI